MSAHIIVENEIILSRTTGPIDGPSDPHMRLSNIDPSVFVNSVSDIDEDNSSAKYYEEVKAVDSKEDSEQFS